MRPPALSLAALALGGCIGIDGLTDAERGRVAAFDFYWQELADNYPLFGHADVDWEELRRQYRAAVPFATRPHEFYQLLAGMFSELGDLHVSFTAPDDALVEDGVAPTSLLDREGFALMPIEGRLFVVSWPEGAAPTTPEVLPAEARYPELWRVGGAPVVASLVGHLLLGPPDSEVELQLRWRDGAVTRHVLRRPPAGTATTHSPLGHLQRDGLWALLRASEPYAHLELRSLRAGLSTDRLDAWIDAANDTEGLVLDLRQNLGGEMAVASSVIGKFLREPVELVFVPPTDLVAYLFFPLDLFVHVDLEPRAPRFDKPVVVLTSSLTASMAEHTARILQRECDAVVVGERTAGAEAGLERARGPDGGTLTYGKTRLVERTGIGLQTDGVVPDVSVRLRLEDLERLGPERAADDWEQRLLRAAERALRSARRR